MFGLCDTAKQLFTIFHPLLLRLDLKTRRRLSWVHKNRALNARGKSQRQWHFLVLHSFSSQTAQYWIMRHDNKKLFEFHKSHSRMMKSCWRKNSAFEWKQAHFSCDYLEIIWNDTAASGAVHNCFKFSLWVARHKSMILRGWRFDPRTDPHNFQLHSSLIKILMNRQNMRTRPLKSQRLWAHGKHFILIELLFLYFS